MKTAPETVDVARLLAEIVDLLAPRAGATVEIGSDMPVLRTRKLPLQQIFMNLIGNALKHNDAPQPHVCVTARRVDRRGAPATWEFAVADNGPGIAPEYHGRIFVIFQTLQPRDKVEGAGMGLSLVKKIVETEGGTIRVDSREGAGATFTFTWPETSRGGA
jgi:signal transduction histidine kinase